MKIDNFWEKVFVEVTSNSLKSIIVIIISSLAVLFGAIYNPFIEALKYVPKTILLLLLLTLLLLLLLSLFYIIYLRKKIKIELKQALGVYWDKELNPYCPACKSILTNYALHRSGDKYYPGLKCIKCKDIIRISDGEKMMMKIEDAKEIVKELFSK